MARKFKAGDAVRQIVVPIQGTVKRFAFHEDTGEVDVIVGWTDKGGDHEVTLAEDQLEADTATEPAPE